MTKAEQMAEEYVCRKAQAHRKDWGLNDDKLEQAFLAGYRAGFKERWETIAEMLAALKGVVAVADRKTDEFDAARAAIAKAEALDTAPEGEG